MTTVLRAKIADFAVVKEVYAEVFAGGVLPARAAYQMAALPRGARVEIEFVGAVVG
jgi:2-iminobutanoate/2-iminopropanoate deaminase